MDCYTAIIFDLDGTLVDSAKDLSCAVNHALQYLGFNKIPLEKVRAEIGHGTKNLVLRSLMLSGVEDPSTCIDKIYDVFLSYYDEHCADNVELHAGAGLFIKKLKAQNKKIILCTNKDESASRKILEKCSVLEYFDLIVGRDSSAYAKPDKNLITFIADKADIDLSNAVLIGDSIVDFQLAKNANIDCKVATFGYFNGDSSVVPKDDFFDRYEELQTRFMA